MALVNLGQVFEAIPDLKFHQFNNNFVQVQSDNLNDKAHAVNSSFTRKVQQQNKQLFLSGVACDSSEVAANNIYIMLPYFNQIPEEKRSTAEELPGLVSVINGRVSQAIENGARVIVSERKVLDQLQLNDLTASGTNNVTNITYLTTTNIEKDLASISKLFYPLQPEWLIAFTGTNGKTSAVTFTRQLLGYLKKNVASLGTLGLQMENMGNSDNHDSSTNNSLRLTNNTTFYAPTFHRCVNTLVCDFRMEYLVFEATSHGLKEHRLHGLQNKIQIGVFTNFTHDHLDYHGSMDDYFESKCKLFSELMIDDGSGIAFLSNKLENKCLDIIKEICKARNIKVWMYGENVGDVHFKFQSDFPSENSHLEYNLWGTKHANINLKRFPKFQVENLLVSLGIVASLLKLSSSVLTDLIQSLPKIIKSVPGRMEFVGQNHLGSKVFVDYAHTPDALETVLSGIKNDFTPMRLIVVFGCSGNRDPSKRTTMGQIAAQHATHVVVTDSNLRHENPVKIRQQVVEGCLQAQHYKQTSEIVNVGGRKNAIRHGISLLAHASDILVICGKGAETYQIIGDKYFDFSDKQVVLDILQENTKL